MKQLYINNKRVVLNPDTYFPFTQKVSVLDDFAIIGMPASKTVTLPRCQENDEIFGYIAEITRIVSSTSDDLIGVSFNQIRKVSYKLYSNSDIISEGIIRIVNITNDGYEIELYDKVIDLIETFSNEDGYLSELELILAGGSYSGYCNAQAIKTLSDANGELKVLANINTDETFDDAVVFTTVLTRATLPNPLTKLQFGTLKPYDFEYAVPLSTIVRSINGSFNDSVEMDSYVTTLFNEVHMILGSPRANKESIIYTCPSNAIGASFGNTSGLSNPSTPLEFKNTSGSWIGTKNGTYQMNLPITLTFYPDTTPEYWGSRKDRPTSALIGVMPDGTYYGDLTVDVYLASYDGGTLKHTGVKSAMNIKMVQGDNTEWESTGGDATKLTVSGYFPFTTEYYPELTDPSYNTYIIVDISRLFSSPSAFLPFYGFGSGKNFTIIKTIDESYKVNFNNKGDVRSGILVSGRNLYPKVTIRDFLIKAAKYFNLCISNNGGNILLHEKTYSISPDTLLVDDITGLEVNNFDFSRLILKTKQPTSPILTEYVENTKRNWAEQVINTGYKIKTSKKEIDFGVGIPSLTSGSLRPLNRSFISSILSANADNPCVTAKADCTPNIAFARFSFSPANKPITPMVAVNPPDSPATALAVFLATSPKSLTASLALSLTSFNLNWISATLASALAYSSEPSSACNISDLASRNSLRNLPISFCVLFVVFPSFSTFFSTLSKSPSPCRLTLINSSSISICNLLCYSLSLILPDKYRTPLGHIQ